MAWRDPRVVAAIVAAIGAIAVALLNPDLVQLIVGWLTDQPACTIDLPWEEFQECQ